MTYLPDKGDIVWLDLNLDFDPSSGKEIMKRRPAFVISRKAFNEHTGMTIVAPITSTVRNIKLEVVLADAVETQGAVLVHQLKSLDFIQRQMTFIEKAPQDVIDQVTTLATIVIR